MPKKKQVRVMIDEAVLAEARELGLNLSRICERAVKQRIKAIKAYEKREATSR